MNNPIRIVLADDHQMLREGFKTLLRKHPEISIVAEASNGEELLQITRLHNPEIVFTDIKMPGIDGIEACRQLTTEFPQISVIALSTFEDEDLVFDMLHAGAKGYLLKNTDKNEVLRAIKAVHEGRTFFSDNLLINFQKLMTQVKNTGEKNKKIVEFSQRELDIITLSSRQLTNKEIGAQLNISTRTVEAHKERMQHRIEAKNIVGVIMYALRHNLITID